MDDSIAHPGEVLPVIELSGWKVWVATSAAVVVSALFLVAGVWKITDAPAAAARLAQARIPEFLSVPAAIGLGIAETFAGVLVLIPRYRRWGAWLISALLVVFMAYVGVHYQALRGEECSCFPWIKRAVGPGFFAYDDTFVADFELLPLLDDVRVISPDKVFDLETGASFIVEEGYPVRIPVTSEELGELDGELNWNTPARCGLAPAG